jgi:hypothetical protein
MKEGSGETGTSYSAKKVTRKAAPVKAAKLPARRVAKKPPAKKAVTAPVKKAVNVVQAANPTPAAPKATATTVSTPEQTVPDAPVQ